MHHAFKPQGVLEEAAQAIKAGWSVWTGLNEDDSVREERALEAMIRSHRPPTPRFDALTEAVLRRRLVRGVGSASC